MSHSPGGKRRNDRLISPRRRTATGEVQAHNYSRETQPIALVLGLGFKSGAPQRVLDPLMDFFTLGTVCDAIMNRAPVAPVRLNPDVPAKLENIAPLWPNGSESCSIESERLCSDSQIRFR
jgi:hypothetical protein